MVGLNGSWNCVTHCRKGVKSAYFHSTGASSYTLFRIGSNVSNAVVVFNAWDSDTDFTQYGDFTVEYPDGTGGTNTDSYPNREIFNISSTATEVTRLGNGGRLLSLANEFKDQFFGGVTQTPESLMAWLQENYGAYRYFYAYTAENASFTYDPWNHAGQGLSSEYGIDCGTVFDVPFDLSADNITITGTSYGEVVSSYPPDSNHWNYIVASFIFSPRIQRNELTFDVYIDGTKDPNVSVRWSANVGDDFSLQLVTPRVWTLPFTQPSFPYIVEGGLLIPNEANPMMRTYSYTWPGQYDKPYLTEFGACTSNMDTFDKSTTWPPLGIADTMYYLLRFNKQKNENNTGVMTWGNCYIVAIPREVESAADVTVTQLDPSANAPEFTDSVVIHIGAAPDQIPEDDDEYPDGTDATGDDPGVYDPDTPPHDFSTGESDGYSGRAKLTRTYSMTELRAQNLGSKLWSQAYYDVLKIQSNPIENIVSVKWFPFSVSGTDTEIKIGDIAMGTNGELVDSIYKFTMGSVYYKAANPSNPSFLDLSPYTTIKLHLPYCGIIQLDATEMLNRKITVKYTVDLVSGDCMAFIYLDDNIPYMNVAGHCGVDIPLTSTNRVQAEMRAASTTLSAVTGAAAHIVSGDLAGAAMDAAQGALSIAGMDYTSQRTSSHSPACTSTGNRGCYLEIFKPAFKESPGFKSRHGYPCHLFKKLGEFKGFVKCDARTKIDFAMTKRENEMLEQLLTSGVYV